MYVQNKILGSQMFKFCYRVDTTFVQCGQCWKSLLQTPFVSSIEPITVVSVSSKKLSAIYHHIHIVTFLTFYLRFNRWIGIMDQN